MVDGAIQKRASLQKNAALLLSIVLSMKPRGLQFEEESKNKEVKKRKERKNEEAYKSKMSQNERFRMAKGTFGMRIGPTDAGGVKAVG